MSSYKCNVCQHIYDPAQGDPLNGVIAGTQFMDLSDEWRCPVCGVEKASFTPIIEEECEPCEMNIS